MKNNSATPKDKTISFLLCLFLGIFGAHKFYDGKTGLGVLYFFTGGLFGIGWIVDTVKLLRELISKPASASAKPHIIKPTPDASPTETTVTDNIVSAPPLQSNSLPDGEKDYNLFDEIKDDCILCYEYEENLSLEEGAIEHLGGKGGTFITFEQEPDNPVDDKAVAIYLGDKRIGYMYKGSKQKMANQFINKGFPVIGYINKYSISENHATYKIGFYRPKDELESKSFSVVKIRKTADDGFMSRAESLLLCNEGDIVTVEQDSIEDTCILYNYAGDEIGELPKSANDFLDENHYGRLVCVLDECNEDSNGNVKAKVTIYLSCSKRS